MEKPNKEVAATADEQSAQSEENEKMKAVPRHKGHKGLLKQLAGLRQYAAGKQEVEESSSQLDEQPYRSSDEASEHGREWSGEFTEVTPPRLPDMISLPTKLEQVSQTPRILEERLKEAHKSVRKLGVKDLTQPQQSGKAEPAQRTVPARESSVPVTGPEPTLVKLQSQEKHRLEREKARHRERELRMWGSSKQHADHRHRKKQNPWPPASGRPLVRREPRKETEEIRKRSAEGQRKEQPLEGPRVEASNFRRYIYGRRAVEKSPCFSRQRRRALGWRNPVHQAPFLGPWAAEARRRTAVIYESPLTEFRKPASQGSSRAAAESEKEEVGAGTGTESCYPPFIVLGARVWPPNHHLTTYQEPRTTGAGPNLRRPQTAREEGSHLSADRRLKQGESQEGSSQANRPACVTSETSEPSGVC
uniref:Uncharacterized protein n=1 Tax=Knipowitschia caucasica TaxID=637954 RepID=A0AAV2J6A4_KNICA